MPLNISTLAGGKKEGSITYRDRAGGFHFTVGELLLKLAYCPSTKTKESVKTISIGRYAHLTFYHTMYLTINSTRLLMTVFVKWSSISCWKLRF